MANFCFLCPFVGYWLVFSWISVPTVKIAAKNSKHLFSAGFTQSPKTFTKYMWWIWAANWPPNGVGKKTIASSQPNNKLLPAKTKLESLTVRFFRRCSKSLDAATKAIRCVSYFFVPFVWNCTMRFVQWNALATSPLQSLHCESFRIRP